MCQLTEAIFKAVLPHIKIVLMNDCTLLGAPISPRTSPKAIFEKHDDLIRMAGRLEQIDVHKAFLWIKNCFVLPKLLYVLHVSPSYLNSAKLGAFGHTICETVSKISNVAFNDAASMQAMLRVKQGGLGFRRAFDIALPGFISLLAVRPLVDAILSQVSGLVQTGELTAAVSSLS